MFSVRVGFSGIRLGIFRKKECFFQQVPVDFQEPIVTIFRNKDMKSRRVFPSSAGAKGLLVKGVFPRMHFDLSEIGFDRFSETKA